MIWLWLTGCAGLLPEELSLDGQAVDRCGAWEATLEGWAWRGTLSLAVDGEPVQQWAVSDRVLETARGRGQPGQAVTLRATLGDAVATQRLELPLAKVEAALEGQLREGEEGWLQLQLHGDCELPLSWSLHGADGPLAEGTDRSPPRIRVPPLPAGTARFELKLQGEGLQPIRTRFELQVAGPCADVDRDGHDTCGDPEAGRPPDCDDADPEVHPGHPELAVANGIDDDCDGTIDEGTTAYDDDGDGYSEDQGDCDDASAGRHPGAAEVWDCRDQDCDGEIDEGVPRPVALTDTHEPNDDSERARHLGGGLRLQSELALVHDSAHDPEWFSLLSDDGPFDSWGIVVSAVALPDHSTWSIEIHDADGLRTSGQLSGEGERLVLTGRGFRSDTGTYRIGILETDAPIGCPATFEVISR